MLSSQIMFARENPENFSKCGVASSWVSHRPERRSSQEASGCACRPALLGPSILQLLCSARGIQRWGLVGVYGPGGTPPADDPGRRQGCGQLGTSVLLTDPHPGALRAQGGAREEGGMEDFPPRRGERLPPSGCLAG